MKKFDILGNALGRSLLFCFFILNGMSCGISGGPSLQPQISSLVVSNRMDKAADKISAQEADYGHGNYLLYYLDRGLVEFYANRYQNSIESFGKAKQRFEQLYTLSVTEEAMSWMLNDYALAYRGADYEYVLINIFQALNFLKQGDVYEAQVEARDLDSKYQVVHDLAIQTQRSSFEDNGFARLFMGMLFEATGDDHAALLWYKQSLTVYESYYQNYVPDILKRGLVRLAEKLYDPARWDFQDRWGVKTDMSGKAQIVIFQLVGFSPLKVAEVIPVPLDRNFATKLAFPKFIKRYYQVQSGQIIVMREDSFKQTQETELGVDIEELAIKDLESRKTMVMSKSVLRPALKYLIERKQKENIKKNDGPLAANIFGVLGNLYNFYSEQADVRSWQSLPAQIRVTNVFVDPGEASLTFEHKTARGVVLEKIDLGKHFLKSGEVQFFTVRSKN